MTRVGSVPEEEDRAGNQTTGVQQNTTLLRGFDRQPPASLWAMGAAFRVLPIRQGRNEDEVISRRLRLQQRWPGETVHRDVLLAGGGSSFQATRKIARFLCPHRCDPPRLVGVFLSSLAWASRLQRTCRSPSGNDGDASVLRYVITGMAVFRRGDSFGNSPRCSEELGALSNAVRATLKGGRWQWVEREVE